MAEGEQTQLAELHHATAAGVVRGAETMVSLGELEFEEREGRARASVLDAIAARAGELVEGLGVAQIGEQLEAVADGVGDSAKIVLGALRRQREQTEPVQSAQPPHHPHVKPRAPTPAPAKNDKPARALIGPTVRVRGDAGDELVTSSELWASRTKR